MAQKKEGSRTTGKKPQVKVTDLKASKDVTGGKKNNKKGGKTYNVA